MDHPLFKSSTKNLKVLEMSLEGNVDVLFTYVDLLVEIKKLFFTHWLGLVEVKWWRFGPSAQIETRLRKSPMFPLMWLMRQTSSFLSE